MTKLSFASVFLSHSSTDKPLVELVARELVRRGIVVWLDKHELQIGLDLSTSLPEAVARQTTTAVFLSEASVRSKWVEDELAVALEKEGGASQALVLPVYLGDALKLVSAHPLLKQRWLHADGDRVSKLGIQVAADGDLESVARTIAREIAKRIYSALKIPEQREIVLFLDQRGNGSRSGIPAGIPQNILSLSAAALVFRPDLAERSQEETLHSEQWRQVSATMQEALADALKTMRWPEPKKIRVLGHAQSGFCYLLGRHFNRNTTAHLFCSNIDGRTFNNQAQPRFAPLEGGNPHCETAHPRIPLLAADVRPEKVALLLSGDSYVAPVLNHLATLGTVPPLVWVKNGLFEDSAQVMAYIADIVALLKRLRDENGVNGVYLFNGLPFHVLPLLAANLLHVVDHVAFMEFRRDLKDTDLQPAETYVQLGMPR